MKKQTPKPPTKEEVKAARLVLRAHYRGKTARRSQKRYIPPSREVREFQTWVHDYRVLLPSVLRTPGSDKWTAGQLAEYCVAAADKMKAAVASRDPRDPEDLARRAHRTHLRTRSVEERRWHRWQELFDACVHEFSTRTDLHASAVIVRAQSVADYAMDAIERRRPPTAKW